MNNTVRRIEKLIARAEAYVDRPMTHEDFVFWLQREREAGRDILAATITPERAADLARELRR